MDSSIDVTDEWIRILEAIHREAVDAIITIDRSGCIESVNPGAEEIFGWKASDMLGRNVSVLMPEPYAQEHDSYIANYLRTGNKRIIGVGREVVGKRRDGSCFPIHLAVNEIVVGGKQLFVGIVRDLSQFKKLQERQATLGRIIEDSLNEVYIFDAETLRYVEANRGARENLNLEMDHLRDMTPIDIQGDCIETEFRELIEPLIRGQVERLEYTTWHRRSDGSSYEVDVHLQPARYRERPVLVAIVLDITRRRDAERAVEKEREAMQSELEQLVEARTRELQMAQNELIRNEKYSTLGKVSGGIAHEIRNPLNAVKTSAYYLLNAKNPSPEKVREHLERIDRQVTLIDNAVTALSDVAKLPDANLKPVDLEPILRSVVDSVSLPPEIKVTFEFPDELPQARIDQNQIVIGFRNLIRNAREAIPEAGTITVAAVTYDDRIEVSVSDTGTGIPAELIEQVLEPLFTTKARGMGLGLSITKAIVEKNRGTLRVESEVGRGSCFRFSLPRA